MAKSVTLSAEVVISKIYLIREHKVMLDDDLAELYQVQTRRLNEQVKRNIDIKEIWPTYRLYPFVTKKINIPPTKNG